MATEFDRLKAQKERIEATALNKEAEEVIRLTAEVSRLKGEIDKERADSIALVEGWKNVASEFFNIASDVGAEEHHWTDEVDKYVSSANPGAPLLAELERLRPVGKQIQAIMETYREQEKSPYGVDTPGGLEHMGDVWSLLSKWDKMLSACDEAGKGTDHAE